MAFVLTIDFFAPHTYIADFIRAAARESGVAVEVTQSAGTISLIGDESDEKLAPFLERLGQELPASVYMEGSRHEIVPGPPPRLRDGSEASRLSLSIGPCPRCAKEMLDPASRRYYYPFTMCGRCGQQAALTEGYPFERSNTLLRFFAPCEACESERETNPFRADFPLISCHGCGVPVRMRDRRSERYANDAESFKRMFEIAAEALVKGKRLRIKTLGGWLLFGEDLETDLAMVTDGGRMGEPFATLEVERNALMSIERPRLRVATGSDEARARFGRSVTLFFADEGFTLLLARELRERGVAYMPCQEADEATAADLAIDYDLAILSQRPGRLFVNKSVRFFVEGERGIFPRRIDRRADRIVAVGETAAVPMRETMLVDRMERLGEAEAAQLWQPEGEASLGHSQTRRFAMQEAAMLSVLVEHDALRERAVGCYFHDEPVFLFYDGKRCVTAVPPLDFETDAIKERIATLREGSDRLVVRFEERFAKEAEALFGAQSLFEAAAAILGLEGGIESVGRAALDFGGKGGVQVDTKLKDNRFDPYAFLASLMSYRLADAPVAMVAYSIFESFGDYVTEVLTQLKNRAKAKHLVLCGRALGNPSLFSRVQKKLPQKALMNRSWPIDEQNALLGALAL